MSAAARLGCAEKDAASVCGARAIVPLEPRADVVDPGSRGREVHAETVARDARGRGRADGIGDEFHDYEHVFYPLARRAASHDLCGTQPVRRPSKAPRTIHVVAAAPPRPGLATAQPTTSKPHGDAASHRVVAFVAASWRPPATRARSGRPLQRLV